MALASQVLVLFAVVLTGTLCRKLRYFTDETIHGVTQLVVNITLPCLTLANMQRPFSYEVLRNFFVTFILSLILVSLTLLGSYYLFSSRPRDKRGLMANLAAMSNCGFMGYPMIMIINPDYMIYAVSYNIAYSIVSWTLGVSLISGERTVHLRKILLNPVLLCCVFGLVLFCTNTALPAVVLDILELIGSMTTPLSMLLVGTRIYGLHLSDFAHWDYPIVSVLRLLVLPVLQFLLLRMLPIDPAVAAAIFIVAAMPCGTLPSMQAELCGIDTRFAARMVALTTALSLVTIPLVCQLL